MLQEWGIDYVDHGLVFAREDAYLVTARRRDQAVPRAVRSGRGAATDPPAMICGTAPRRSCSPQASTSHSCRSVLVTVR